MDHKEQAQTVLSNDHPQK